MIRYRKLGYLAFNVTDLNKSVSFYENLVGLTSRARNPGEPALLSCTSDQQCVALYPAREAGLKRLAFELESQESLEELGRALFAEGVAYHEVPATEVHVLGIDRGIRCDDPDGLPLEFYVGMRQLETSTIKPTGINALSHAVAFVPNFAKSVDFYTRVLNFKVSDFRHKPDGKTYFAYLRCFPNPYHHSFAIVESTPARFFHAAFSMRDLDELMIGRNRLIDHQVTIAAAPGRHKASGSIFQYFSDPDGLTLEFTLGMEEFSEHDARPPRSLDSNPRTSDVWGGPRADNLPNLGRMESHGSPQGR